MNDTNIKHLVTWIVDAKRADIPDTEIIQQLVSHGVSEENATKILSSVTAGFKSGVTAVITGGASAEGYVPGEDPFYDLAFRKGEAVMRFTTPFWVLMKYLVLLLIGLIIIGVIIWEVMR